MRWVRRIAGVLFLLGAGLLVLHLSGRLVPLRNPDIYTARTGFKDDITLTYEEARAQLARRPGESDEQFAVRATDVVNRGMAHYWKDEGIDKYRLRLPPWENYLFWIAGLIDPKGYGKWEFADSDKALERGVGLCSQQTIILVRALRQNGVPAAIVGLDGHVVAMARVGPGHDILLDPDYGVVVPHSIAEVQGDPEIVRPYYAAKYRPKRVDHLVDVYGPQGNFIDPSGDRKYTSMKRIRETVFYTAAWAFPLALMAPYGIGMTVFTLLGTARRRRERGRRP